jgi:hypothetical protein
MSTLMTGTVVTDGSHYYELQGDVEARALTSESEEDRRARSVFPVQEVPEPEAFRPPHPKPEIVHGDGPRSSTSDVHASE